MYILTHDRARFYDPNTGRFLQKDPEPGKLDAPGSVVNSYAYVLNSPINLTDPNGRAPFLLALLYAAIYSAVISAAQAGIQMLLNHEDWGEGGKNFWGKFGINFAFNFGFSAIGMGWSALKENVKDFSLGWGGVYSTSGTGKFSLGFYQSSPSGRIGSALYWHEVGHSINWAIGGALTGPNWSDRAWFTLGWFGLHGLGAVGTKNPGDFNPFTVLTEGAADLWSAPWFGFDTLRNYPFIIPR